MVWVALVVAVVASVIGFAFRAPSALEMWAILGIGYALLAAVAMHRLIRTQRASTLLGFRRGDPTIGIALGIVQLSGAWLFVKFVLPGGEPERAWLLRVFLLVGDSSEATVSVMLLLLVVCEELVWRGLVQSELRERLGPRRGWIAAAVLYAAAHLATLFSLADPAAGKNPLVVLAALGCGLCWGFLAERTGRLVPGLFAHGVFSYFAAQSFWLFV